MREEDYHTHFVGRTSDGKQFFGYETFVFPARTPGQDWEKLRKEYVVLYTFDSKGNHINTNHWYAGTTAEISADTTRSKLMEMVDRLGPIEYCDIAVKPFKTIIDGVEFGLIPDDETESIELQPSSTIAFSEPWDGEYDT
ncbi:MULTISPECIES: hypothetical protein [unclassified Imperialibacter]|uniref:hypothetical protein n=1 Tax=unclassified Imperialibacter TaxID=2629706 RepID=UPI00125EA18B|nr:MULTISPECIES: hypothetical protein [unclassified Imperialibacter]